MIRRVVSVFDSKSAVYMAPFCALTISEAVRIFEDAVRDDKTLLNRHPADFSLCHIADFDDTEGCFINFNCRVLAQASEFVDG